MFIYAYPFPHYEVIVVKYPELIITEEVYAIARAFYLGSLEAEADKLSVFIRTKDMAEEEQEFIDGLINNAVHVAIGHAGSAKR